ncbi:hypothetical protein C2G38_2309201 [Gigaspora rosea]|uniref:BED-type domain-containing protein n=1 Tax=Gigaspora rosea TaxID=44941 RepID=A0A397VHP7_9GLOM|nr:hypothetical protein C2G38_2309201 [Gigaspora rosea]
MSSDDDINNTSASNTRKNKKNIGGRPVGPVWNYFTKGEKVGKGRYKATCNFCGTTWKRGEPVELESHLANHCSKANSQVVRKFLTKILSDNSDEIKSNKKRKTTNSQSSLSQFVISPKLDNPKIKRIHNAWTRAFTICGISWNIIENPFFIEALKEMNLSYEPPTRQLLSGQLLEQQLAIINEKTKKIFKQYSNLTLESKNATLGDCFLSLAKTSATIKKLPIHQYSEFRNYCYNVLNKRFKEFDDDLYILGYFLTPNYRNIGFKSGQFSRIIKIVGSISKKFGNDEADSNILTAHLRLYKENKYPYNESYVPGVDIPIIWWNSIDAEPNYLRELALIILSIVPNSASCERNFSLLTWLTSNKHIQLNTQKLETIAKLCTYYNSNAKKELSYFANNMDEKQLLEILNQTNIENFKEVLEREDVDEDELLLFDNLELNESSFSIKTKDDLVLFLENSIDLNDNFFVDDLEKFPDNDDDFSDNNEIEIDEDKNINNEENQVIGKGNYDWDPEDLVNSDDD